MADIPGLIEGASTGAGLGIRCLKHLSRTRLLLHVVDIAPLDEREQPSGSVTAVVRELEAFSSELATMPRWLVLNKIDLLDAGELGRRRRQLVDDLAWEGPVFEVSATTGRGTGALGQAVVRELERQRADDLP